MNYELWIMIDDYDLWSWFMIMIYDYDLWFSASMPIIHGLPIDNPWISADYPWTSMDTHEWSMDMNGLSWIAGNPFRHQVARHPNWEDFNLTNLDRFFVRFCAKAEVFRFSFVCAYAFLILCYFILRRTVDLQGSV